MCSILALKSCKGYFPDAYHMWCCTARQCNILYTKAAMEDLGVEITSPLDFIQCTSTMTDGESAAVVAPAPDPAGPPPQTQEAGSTAVRVVNFAGLPPDVTAEVLVTVPETQVAGRVSVAKSAGTSELYGTYYLSPDAVLQLAQAIEDDLVCPI